MILFVCSQSKLRSRTAEILCLFGGIDARCCGTEKTAEYLANDNLIREADIIFCMENEHNEAIKEFQHYGACDIFILDIEDKYNLLDDKLIKELIKKTDPYSKYVSNAIKKGYDKLNQP